MEDGENLILRDTYVNSLARSLFNGSALANVPDLIKTIIENQMWKERVVSQTKRIVSFKSFREFVEASPPEGLKTSINLLIRICTDYDDMEAVSLISTEVGGNKGGNNNPCGIGGWSHKLDENLVNVSNTNIDKIGKPVRGDTTDYAIRRLAKHCPDIHSKVLSGDMSLNAASVLAGFRSEKYQIPQDPVMAARYLAKRVDREWFVKFCEEYVIVQNNKAN